MVKNKKKGLYRALCLSTAMVIISSNPVCAKGTLSVSVPVQCITKNVNEKLTYHITAEAQSDGQKIQNRIVQLKNNEKGFFDIEYLCPGTYKYEIKQFSGVYENIEYDDRIFQATVFVSEENNGNMNATLITYEKGSKDKSNGVVFINKEKEESDYDKGLEEAKKDTIDSLTNIVGKVPTHNADKADEILKDYIDKINSSTSIEEVNKNYQEGKDKLESLIGNPDKYLEEAKKDAVDKLTDISETVPSKNSEIANEILKEYIDKINSATSKEEVKDLFEKCKNILVQLGANPNGKNYDKNSSLADAKNNAIAILTGKKYSCDKAIEILNKYIEKIKAVDSIEEVNRLLEEAQKALAEYIINDAQSHLTGSNNADTSDDTDVVATGMTLISSIGLAFGLIVAAFNSKRRGKK